MEVRGRRRETSRHRETSRFALPIPVGRAATVLLPALSLLPAVVATVAVQALSPVAQRVPTGDARFDLAGAWLATEPGALAGTTSWLPAPTLGRLQLGLLVRAVQGGGAQSVLAAAHGGMLLLTVLAVVLLWSALRRRGSGGVACGLAAAAFGIAPVAVVAHAAVSVQAVAVVWLLLAAVLVLDPRRTPALVAGGAAAAVAVASVPAALVAVVPLAVLLGLRLRRRRRELLAVGAGFAGAAVVLAAAMTVLAALPATPATAALDRLTAAQGGPAAGGAAFAAWLQVDPVGLLVALGAVLLALLGARDRALAVLVAVLALAAVWPFGDDVAAPLVLLLPAVAAAVAVSVDVGAVALGHPLLVRSVLGAGWLTAVAALLVVGVVGWLVGLGGLVRAADRPVAAAHRWVAASVPAGQTVLVGLGIWPDLAAGSRASVGWYAGRAGAPEVPSSVPWDRADYVVTDASLPAHRTGAAATVLARSLPVARFGSGTAALAVRAVREADRGGRVTAPTTAAGRRAQAERRSAGRQLAENPRIEIDGRDRARLLAGEVDTRIALVLAQLVTAHTVTVTGFGIADGDRSGVRTTVTVGEVDGRAVPSDGTRTGVLLRFLSDLRGDFAVASIDADDAGITAAFRPDPDLVLAG